LSHGFPNSVPFFTICYAALGAQSVQQLHVALFPHHHITFATLQLQFSVTAMIPMPALKFDLTAVTTAIFAPRGIRNTHHPQSPYFPKLLPATSPHFSDKNLL
jgi:hypothetical protein